MINIISIIVQRVEMSHIVQLLVMKKNVIVIIVRVMTVVVNNQIKKESDNGNYR